MNQKQNELKRKLHPNVSQIAESQGFLFFLIWKQPEKMNIEKLKVKEQEKNIMQMLI